MENTMKRTIKMLTKMAVVAALALVLLTPANAQEGLSILSWSISLPSGNTKDFSLDNESFRGITFTYRYFPQPNMSFGLYGGWHVFNGETLETVEVDHEEFQGAVTGKQWRYINSFPIMANVHFYSGSPGRTQLFLGVNAGGMVIEERLDINIWAIESSKWHWAVAPEVGVNLPLGYNAGLAISAVYHYAFSAGEKLVGESSKHQYISINIGVSWGHSFF
jgi:hypothetical protein